MNSGKPAPPAADPRPGHNPGYAEDRPRDKSDVRKPHAREEPSPDEGGVDRDAENAEPIDEEAE
jgi:hypothetical protein